MSEKHLGSMKNFNCLLKYVWDSASEENIILFFLGFHINSGT